MLAQVQNGQVVVESRPAATQPQVTPAPAPKAAPAAAPAPTKKQYAEAPPKKAPAAKAAAAAPPPPKAKPAITRKKGAVGRVLSDDEW